MRIIYFLFFFSIITFSQEFYIDCNKRVIQGSYFNLSFVLKYDNDAKIEKDSPKISDFTGNKLTNLR